MSDEPNYEWWDLDPISALRLAEGNWEPPEHNGELITPQPTVWQPIERWRPDPPPWA